MHSAGWRGLRGTGLWLGSRGCEPRSDPGCNPGALRGKLPCEKQSLRKGFPAQRTEQNSEPLGGLEPSEETGIMLERCCPGAIEGRPHVELQISYGRIERVEKKT